jgi:ribulose-bisphosphate carboxylase large chain
VTIAATSLVVSGLRFAAKYALRGPIVEARERAESIAVEQTIEFPADLVADDDIRGQVIGRIESIRNVEPDLAVAEISYAVETTGGELPQLLNVLFGNCSLLPDVRLVDISLPDEFLTRFRGPQFGVEGLRELIGVHGRPLLGTALKPMGLGSGALAEMAGTLARAGIDLIKDDHGLANQPFAEYEDRVGACAAAVRAANDETGRRALYLPSINAPADQVESRARAAREAGAGGLLVLPGLAGFDTMRHLADGAIGLPIMAHPAFLGSYVVTERSGVEHGLMLGTLMRLAGADMTVFPSYGGRFTFDPEACRSISTACETPLGRIAPIMPVPGGGMTLSRVDELVTFYGADSVLLIGGNLHRGDLFENASRMRAAVEESAG